jgi:hypothetical protein
MCRIQRTVIFQHSIIEDFTYHAANGLSGDDSTMRDVLSAFLSEIPEVGLPAYGQYLLSGRTLDEPKVLNIDPLSISFSDFIPPFTEN